MGCCNSWTLLICLAAFVALGHSSQYDFGRDVKDRKTLDSWNNAMYIPEPDVRLPKPGVVARWQFYARRTGTVYLQVWRAVSRERRPATWILIGQNKYVATVGKNVVYASSKIDVRSGDALGFYFPGSSVIPFDGHECYTKRGLYVKNPRMVMPGKTFRFSPKQRGWNPCRQYSLKVTIVTPLLQLHGETPKSRAGYDLWTNAMFIVNPSDPMLVNGEVTKWSYYSKRSGRVALQVWRKSGYGYQLVGQTFTRSTGSGLQNVPLTSSSVIKVRKGDLLGFYFPGASVIPFDGRECYTERTLYVKTPTSVQVGKVFRFRTKQTGWKPCRKYSLRASITYYKLSAILGSTNQPPGEGGNGGGRSG